VCVCVCVCVCVFISQRVVLTRNHQSRLKKVATWEEFMKELNSLNSPLAPWLLPSLRVTILPLLMLDPGARKLPARSLLNSEARLRAREWRTPSKPALRNPSVFLLSRMPFLQELSASAAAKLQNVGLCLAGRTKSHLNKCCLSP
jgi:hypothetical protein